MVQGRLFNSPELPTEASFTYEFRADGQFNSGKSDLTRRKLD